MTKAAELSHVGANHMLGSINLKKCVETEGAEESLFQRVVNIFVTKNDCEISLARFNKAAEQKYAEAQFALGKIYLEGNSRVKQDLGVAINWLTKAAEQKYAEAQFTLGKIYLEGKDGLEKDMDVAISWLTKAAKQKHQESQLTLGNFYLKENDIAKQDLGIVLLKEAAAQNHPEALYKLGLIYSEAQVKKQELKASVDWFTQAAELGHAGAQYKLAEAICKGRGIDANPILVERWLQKAMEQDYADANYMFHQLIAGEVVCINEDL